MTPARFLIATLTLSLAACATTPRDDSAYLAHLLVGSWIEEDDDPECPGHSLYKFRSDGKYTVTHEGCDIISDGFGIFHYGWYIAQNHLCFVNFEEEVRDKVRRPRHFRARFLDHVRRGFVEEHCRSRLEQVDARTLRLVPREPDSRPTFMRRARW